MLGRLRMTIDECIEVFQHVSETVFGDIPGTFSRLKKGLSGKPFFKADRLEKIVKELLISRGVDPDTLLKDSEHARCKVYVIQQFPFWMALLRYFAFLNLQANECPHSLQICLRHSSPNRPTCSASLLHHVVRRRRELCLSYLGGSQSNCGRPSLLRTDKIEDIRSHFCRRRHEIEQSNYPPS
jgi:hypothetical protein